MSAADIDFTIPALQTVRVELDAHSRQGRSQAVSRWAGSGAMALTGPAEGSPDVAPAAIAPRIDALAHGIARSSDVMGQPVQLAGVELLGERAAIAGLTMLIVDAKRNREGEEPLNVTMSPLAGPSSVGAMIAVGF